MIMPHDFKPFVGSAVFASQDREIILGKQAVLANVGREVRGALNELSGDIANDLVSAYKPASPQLVSAIENSILAREFSIENMESGATLDNGWANGDEGLNRRMDEAGLGADDPWNTP